MPEKSILITGATGKQGGATLRHLAKRGGWKLRALTRKPDSDAAKAIAALGAEIVVGDLDDAGSLERALAGVWGVYAVENTWEAGVEKEEEQGKRLAKLAREKGVQHFVYASVGSAHKATGIPHFDNKFRIEQTVKALGFPSYTIIRPVFFMENLLAPWSIQGDKLAMGLSPNVKLQMIAADDIGRFGAKAFIDAEQMKNAELDIAGDAITMTEAAAGLGTILGKPLGYQPIPIEVVRQQSEDLAKMNEWFESTGYSADIASLEKRYGIRPLTFQEWVRTQKK
jgi:uncharacterized protein YbjT (DUF2867 family)